MTPPASSTAPALARAEAPEGASPKRARHCSAPVENPWACDTGLLFHCTACSRTFTKQGFPVVSLCEGACLSDTAQIVCKRHLLAHFCYCAHPEHSRCGSGHLRSFGPLKQFLRENPAELAEYGLRLSDLDLGFDDALVPFVSGKAERLLKPAAVTPFLVDGKLTGVAFLLPQQVRANRLSLALRYALACLEKENNKHGQHGQHDAAILYAERRVTLADLAMQHPTDSLVDVGVAELPVDLDGLGDAMSALGEYFGVERPACEVALFLEWLHEATGDVAYAERAKDVHEQPKRGAPPRTLTPVLLPELQGLGEQISAAVQKAHDQDAAAQAAKAALVDRVPELLEVADAHAKLIAESADALAGQAQTLAAVIQRADDAHDAMGALPALQANAVAFSAACFKLEANVNATVTAVGALGRLGAERQARDDALVAELKAAVEARDAKLLAREAQLDVLLQQTQTLAATVQAMAQQQQARDAQFAAMVQSVQALARHQAEAAGAAEAEAEHAARRFSQIAERVRQADVKVASVAHDLGEVRSQVNPSRSLIQASPQQQAEFDVGASRCVSPRVARPWPAYLDVYSGSLDLTPRGFAPRGGEPVHVFTCRTIEVLVRAENLEVTRIDAGYRDAGVGHHAFLDPSISVSDRLRNAILVDWDISKPELRFSGGKALPCDTPLVTGLVHAALKGCADWAEPFVAAHSMLVTRPQAIEFLQHLTQIDPDLFEAANAELSVV